MKKYLTGSDLETKKIALEIVKAIAGGETILLYGNLGVGKTTFVQGLAEGLGVKDRILSPTFILIRNHKIKNKPIKFLHHVDLYRLDKKTDIENLGLSEMINEQKSVVVIEWAEKLSGFDLKKGYKIYLEYLGENKREIKIEKYG